jgi:hypothetical protein
MRKKPMAIVGGLFVALTVGRLVAHSFAAARPAGPVYTVAQVVAGMAHHPRAWYGHTVTVRGVAVLVEWPVQDQSEPDGYSCTEAGRCSLHVPTDTPLDEFLVAAVPHKGAGVYSRLLMSLAMARSVQPTAPGAPPNLVVMALPTSAQLINALRPYVPRPILNAIAQVPLIGRPLAQSATVQGGTPQLYRVHLWPLPATPPGTRAACDTACADGELLG